MLKINNLTDKAEMYIYGVIVDDTDVWYVQDDDGNFGYQFPTGIKKQLDELKGKTIDVHIASDGGDVGAGFCIYNMLKNHDAPVTVYIDKWAASIASVIAFAGSKIVMPENAYLMIHNPKCEVFGDGDYLRKTAEWLDKIRDTIANTYIGHMTGDNASEKVKSMMDEETWFTAKEASEMFDCVEVVENNNNIKAVAQLDTSYVSAPASLKEMVETVDVAETEEKEEATEPVNTVVDETKNKILKVLQEAYKYEEES